MTGVSTATVSVLVVDDNDDHRHLIERRLGEAGYRVHTTGSGTEAVTMLEGIDIVLLDYRLPGMSGLETLEAINAVGGPSVVMVTGMGSESIAVEAMRAGAIDYVVKDSGYLQAMPQIVERAWRHHDLARRAEELQRLALLVTSASDRETTFDAVVGGARRLLRADTAALFVAGAEGLALEAVDGADIIDVALVQSAAGTMLSSDVEVVTDVGDESHLLVALPARDGGPLGVLALITNEPRKHADEEISLAATFASFAGMALANLHRLELERDLVTELRSMLELRQEFVAGVSHELRTPLTCINGFSSTLVAHWAKISEADRLDFVEKIKHHGDELEGLVERFLDYASLEAGRLQADLRAVDIRAEVEAVLGDLGPLIDDRPVAIEGVHLLVHADPALVRSTLSNLVSNAVKYSDTGSPVAIDIIDAGEGMVSIEVTDRGIGLAPAEAERVFDAFWRARRGVHRLRGTGIGLALVKEYVRLMGGTVAVRSRPDEGSTFSFTLPRQEIDLTQSS